MAEGRTKNLAQIKERVIAEIKWLAKKGEPLNISAVKWNHPMLLKTVFAVRPFWGWKKAIEDTGLEYSRIRGEYRRTVTCRLCNKEFLGLCRHLCSHGITARQYHARFLNAPTVSEAAAASMFMSLSPSSMPGVPHWEYIWTPEYTLDRLHAIYGYDPQMLEYIAWPREEELLMVKCREFFGSLPAALEAAGIPRQRALRAGPAAPRTAEAVISFIQERAAKGLPINIYAIVKDRCFAALAAAREVFGSYRMALKAAGFDPKEVRKKSNPGIYPTEESVLAAIKKRHLLGKPLNHAGVARGRHVDLALWNRGRRLFGAWPKALEKAGIDPESVSKWRYRTPLSVIQAIQRRLADKSIPVTAIAVRKGLHAEPTHYDGAFRHFGNWPKAVQAAGGRYAVRLGRPSVPCDRAELVAAMRKRHAAGLPMSSSAIVRGPQRDALIANAYGRHFGSWHAALRAAGLEAVIRSLQHPYPTPEAVVAGLRARMKANLSVSSLALFCGPSPDRALYDACRKHFGPYREALRAARSVGKTEHKPANSVSGKAELMQSFGIG